MFCTNCGSVVEDGQAFCTNCGQPVEQVESVPVAPRVQQAQPPYATPAIGQASVSVPAAGAAAASASGGGKKTGAIIGVVVAAVLVAAIAGMAFAQVGPFASKATDTGSSTVSLGDGTNVVNEQSQENIAESSATVGDYAGLTSGEAEDALAADALALGAVSEEYREDVAEGAVASQSLAAGEQVEKGTAIDLVVSKGPAPHTYTVVEQPMTWAEAKAYCESQGGYLVCIGSQEEDEQVKSMVSGSGCTLFWIGAQRDSSGNFAWVNGEPMTYTGWAGGEPNNDGGNENVAAIFSTANGIAWYDTLNDVSAYYKPTTLAFVMEKVEK